MTSIRSIGTVSMGWSGVRMGERQASKTSALDRIGWTELARQELVDLIGIESFSDHEHAAVDHLVRRCDRLGLPVRRLPVQGSADDLLVGWSERPELLLTAHVDTVRPTWDWSGRAEARGDRIFGLGAQDDKGCVIAALLALLMAQRAGAPVEELPVGVGLCVDEERGGKGSAAMAEALAPRFVIGLEGTGLRIGLAEAGFVEVWVRLSGDPVHGALRELGENAIDNAVSLIERVRHHPASQHVHPLLGRNIPMVWEIHGGEPLNVVPAACDVHLDWRVTPGGPSSAELFDELIAMAAELGGTVEPIEVVEPFETVDPRLPTALGAAIRRVTGRAAEPMGMVAWTDAHNFVDLAGSHAVIFGPGDLRDAHRPDESISLTDVLTCAEILARIAVVPRDLFGGDA